MAAQARQGSVEWRGSEGTLQQHLHFPAAGEKQPIFLDLGYDFRVSVWRGLSQHTLTAMKGVSPHGCFIFPAG